MPPPRVRSTPAKTSRAKDPVNGDSQGGSQTARATLSLRELLLEGKFQPGERIREVPLSEEMKVSRIPLRIALERLANEGLLEVRPTTGFVVPQFSVDDIYDSIQLRGLLEGNAARLAAERVKDAREVAALHALSYEMIALVQRRTLTLDCLAAYIELNVQFHTELVRLSGSRILRRALEHVSSLPFASPSSFLRRHYLAPQFREIFLLALDHHRSVAEAISSNDGARAESIMREHANLAWRNLEFALQSRELAKFVPGAKLMKLTEVHVKKISAGTLRP
jgi:GntR family transcriptional regulator, vanillate catabolism transcriptional regulator